MRFNSRTECDAGARLVVKTLAIMLLEILVALLHFDQHDGFPHVIGEGCPATVRLVLVNAKFRRAANIEGAGLTEGLKEPVEEDLRLTLFVTRNVPPTPRSKFSEFFPARHGGLLQEKAGTENGILGLKAKG